MLADSRECWSLKIWHFYSQGDTRYFKANVACLHEGDSEVHHPLPGGSDGNIPGGKSSVSIDHRSNHSIPVCTFLTHRHPISSILLVTQYKVSLDLLSHLLKQVRQESFIASISFNDIRWVLKCKIKLFKWFYCQSNLNNFYSQWCPLPDNEGEENWEQYYNLHVGLATCNVLSCCGKYWEWQSVKYLDKLDFVNT